MPIVCVCVLHLSLTHTTDPSVVVKPKTGQVPSGDVLLGEAFVNVVDLTTARIKNMDQWFHLSDVSPYFSPFSKSHD